MKISIIIPCYNDEENLRNCLKTIPQDSSIEVIIIDDCSDIAIPYATYRNECNQGPGASRQKGLELSSGDYIIFMDSDDCFITDNFKLYYEGINNCYNIIRDTQYYPYGTIQGICFNKTILNEHKFLNDYFFQDIIFLYKILQKEKNILITENLWIRNINNKSITAFKHKYTADALGLFSTSLFIQQDIDKNTIHERLYGALNEEYAKSFPAAGRRAYFFFYNLINPQQNYNKKQNAMLLHKDVEILFSDEKASVINSLHKYIDIALEL